MSELGILASAYDASAQFAAHMRRHSASAPVVVTVKRKRWFRLSHWLRAMRGEQVEYYDPPPSIPDKKTLVLDLDQTLIHSSAFPPHRNVESFHSGSPAFYVYKRPGLDGFLARIRFQFNIFIYTHGCKEYASSVIDAICPWVDASHRLYRDACVGRHGNRKDLRILARSKREVILVDDSKTVASDNPKNTILITPWFGVPYDTKLIDWLPEILDKCAAADDVRPIIKSAAPPEAKTAKMRIK
jgi:Dullard-like phosphatase family protein